MTPAARPLSRCVIVAALIATALFAPSGAAAARQTEQAPRHIRSEAPEPWRPAGDLHFLGLTPLYEGHFVDPDSVRPSNGRVELRLLTVGGPLRHVAEGDIRWTWERLDIDCAGRSSDTLELDAYDTEGAWLAGFTGPILGTNPVDVPSEEALLAYACDGTRPPAFQSVPDQSVAVAGIIQAYANR